MLVIKACKIDRIDLALSQKSLTAKWKANYLFFNVKKSTSSFEEIVFLILDSERHFLNIDSSYRRQEVTHEAVFSQANLTMSSM
jgi:hypothetical protein